MTTSWPVQTFKHHLARCHYSARCFLCKVKCFPLLNSPDHHKFDTQIRHHKPYDFNHVDFLNVITTNHKALSNNSPQNNNQHPCNESILTPKSIWPQLEMQNIRLNILLDSKKYLSFHIYSSLTWKSNSDFLDILKIKIKNTDTFFYHFITILTNKMIKQCKYTTSQHLQ